jgi:Ca-activated chloride channel family protein
MSVGNLPPGKSVKITITYVAQLETEGESLRFVLPTTIAPRYTPPDLQATSPKLVDIELEKEVPYKLTVQLNIQTVSDIQSIQSPSHSIQPTINGSNAKLKLENVKMDSDFVVLISETATGQSSVIIEDWDKANDPT